MEHSQQKVAKQTGVSESSDFTSLLNKEFKPKSDE
jgi:hypothetical protein